MNGRPTIRLPEELLQMLREESRMSGLAMARLVRDALEKSLSDDKDSDEDKNQIWRRFAGILKGGPPDLSSRKGFSHK